MTIRKLDVMCILACLTLAIFPFLGEVSLGETNRQIMDESRIESAQIDTIRDGAVDYKVFFRITNTVVGASVAAECDHRVPGTPNWLIRIKLTNGIGRGNSDMRLIAGATILSVDSLCTRYAADPIREVVLKPEDVASDFSTALLKSVAGQMGLLDSKPRRFDHPRVREMVKNAFEQMEYVEYMKRRLEGAGFSVKVYPAELCCLRRSVVDMAWKDIVREPDVGLNLESIACCFILEPTTRR
jgi:hypothetical protein